MAKLKNYTLTAGSGNVKITGFPVTLTVSQVNDAVEISSEIPADAEIAIKDLFQEIFSGGNWEKFFKKLPDYLDSVSDFLELLSNFNLTVSEKVMENLSGIIDMLKALGNVL